jgi:hypothetical protein
MKKFLGMMSVLAFLGGTAYTLKSAKSFKRNAFLTPEVASAFNASEVAPAPAPVPVMGARPMMPAASPMPIRDAVASPVFVSAASMLKGPPPAAPAAAKFPTPQKPVAAYDVSKDGMVRSLLAGPAAYMASKTLLRSPSTFKAFMNDSNRVSNYVNHRLISSFLNSPTLIKTFAGQPAITKAFINSPAMQDKKTVEDLFKSRLFSEVMKGRGVKELLADPAFLQKVMMDPDMVQWFGANPAAMRAITAALPQLSSAMGTHR